MWFWRHEVVVSGAPAAGEGDLHVRVGRCKHDGMSCVAEAVSTGGL
jgi:hypothetical protein